MSKDYICKYCDNNKNGWCIVRKCQGLKSITECEVKNIKSLEDNTENGSSNKLKNFKLNNIDETSKIFGKLEMLWSIQKQVLVIDEDIAEEEKFNAVLKVLNSIEQMLVFSEDLYNVCEAIKGSVIDSDIMMDSMHMAKIIKEKVK